MPQKMMSPNTLITWVPVSGVTDPDAPTATELNAGTNISCAIVRGYTLNPTASDTDTTASICDEGNVDNRTYANYEGNITFFRDSNINDNVSVFNKAWALFRRAGARGYLYRRVGQKSTVAWAAGNEAEGFLFESDWPQTIDGGDNGGPIQFTVPFLQQGKHTGMVYVGPIPAATISGIAPNTGIPLLGNVPVVITGTNYLGVIGITVGGTPVLSFTVDSPTQITAIVPPKTAGTQPVVVTTPAGATAGTNITYA